VNYKAHVEQMALDIENRLILSIRSGQQQTLRPAEILATVFDLPDEIIKTARIVKLAPQSAAG
jgi:hypothetical protein